MPITAHYLTNPEQGQQRLNAGAIALLSGRPVTEVAQWRGQLPPSAKVAAEARITAVALAIGSSDTREVLHHLAKQERATLVVDGRVWVVAGIEAARD